MRGRWFSPGTPVFSTNKTDRRDITEILLKVAFNTITTTIAMTSERCSPLYIMVLVVLWKINEWLFKLSCRYIFHTRHFYSSDVSY